jgi:salicylate hydroxylase
VLSLVGRIDFGRCQSHQAREISPPAALSRGNLVLVGDAAHGSLPFTGRGTNDALIDAALLGNLLATARSPEEVRESFARYSELREPQRRRTLQEDVALRSAFLEPVGRGGPRLPVVA